MTLLPLPPNEALQRIINSNKHGNSKPINSNNATINWWKYHMHQPAGESCAVATNYLLQFGKNLYLLFHGILKIFLVVDYRMLAPKEHASYHLSHLSFLTSLFDYLLHFILVPITASIIWSSTLEFLLYICSDY